MSKAVRFYELGGPEVLKIEDLTVPSPGAGEVKLKVKAIGLNRAELMYMQGGYMEQPQLPSRLGYEASGTVTAVGEGVDGSLVGKQVATLPGYSMNRYGVLAEEANVPARSLFELPPSFSPTQSAASLMQYGTAYGALVEIGKVGHGDFVIIPAASSSVGLAAIEICRVQGATPIAATRTSAKRQQLLDFGAPYVIATEEEDLPARVQQITAGKGARIIFDPVGGDYVATLAKAVAVEGTIFLYGGLSGKPTVYPREAWGKGAALLGYSLLQMQTPERMEPMRKFIVDGLASGALKPKIDRVFPFEQVREAYEYMAGNTQVGKIVVEL